MNVAYWWKWKSKQKRRAGQAPFRAMVCSEQQDAFRTTGIQIKNILFILFMLSFLGFHLNGCTTKYGTREPDQKQALRTLAGGVAGVLLAAVLNPENPGESAKTVLTLFGSLAGLSFVLTIIAVIWEGGFDGNQQ